MQRRCGTVARGGCPAGLGLVGVSGGGDTGGQCLRGVLKLPEVGGRRRAAAAAAARVWGPATVSPARRGGAALPRSRTAVRDARRGRAWRPCAQRVPAGGQVRNRYGWQPRARARSQSTPRQPRWDAPARERRSAHRPGSLPPSRRVTRQGAAQPGAPGTASCRDAGGAALSPVESVRQRAAAARRAGARVCGRWKRGGTGLLRRRGQPLPAACWTDGPPGERRPDEGGAGVAARGLGALRAWQRGATCTPATRHRQRAAARERAGLRATSAAACPASAGTPWASQAAGNKDALDEPSARLTAPTHRGVASGGGGRLCCHSQGAV
jgi:hypothetical protein